MKEVKIGTEVWYVGQVCYGTWYASPELLHGKVAKITHTENSTLVTVDLVNKPTGYDVPFLKPEDFSFTPEEAVKAYINGQQKLLDYQLDKYIKQQEAANVKRNLVVEGGEYITISSGTSINLVEVRRGGSLQIANGGRVVGLTINSGGSCNLHSVGEVAQVRVHGIMYCSGWMTEVDVLQGGSLIVCPGNSVTDIEVRNNGHVEVRSGASVYLLRATCAGYAEVKVGANVSKAVADTDGTINLTPAASVTSVTASSYGVILVEDGAKVHEAIVNSGGTMCIAQAAEISAMVKDSGGRIKECKCVL